MRWYDPRRLFIWIALCIALLALAIVLPEVIPTRGRGGLVAVLILSFALIGLAALLIWVFRGRR